MSDHQTHQTSFDHESLKSTEWVITKSFSDAPNEFNKLVITKFLSDHQMRAQQMSDHQMHKRHDHEMCDREMSDDHTHANEWSRNAPNE